MKYTKEEMEVVIIEWQSSGLSKKAFCRERNIVYQTFHNWYKRLNTSTTPGFVELSLPQRDRHVGYEIVFPSGARMIFQGEPSASWLREVLR